jgi:hypothetical protein
LERRKRKTFFLPFRLGKTTQQKKPWKQISSLVFKVDCPANTLKFLVFFFSLSILSILLPRVEKHGLADHFHTTNCDCRGRSGPVQTHSRRSCPFSVLFVPYPSSCNSPMLESSVVPFERSAYYCTEDEHEKNGTFDKVLSKG